MSKSTKAHVLYFFVLLKKHRGESVLFDFREGTKSLISGLKEEGNLLDGGYAIRTPNDSKQRDVFDLGHDDKKSLGQNFSEIELEILQNLVVATSIKDSYKAGDYDWFFYIRLKFKDDNEGLARNISISLPALMMAVKFFTVQVYVD